jgi:hypothetical protein
MISRSATPVACLSALALLVACTSASAAPRPADLWATVNICDTVRHPNQMGVRASMPGDGTREQMFMRFRAQFYDATKKKWFPTGNGKSDWISAGSAHFKARQAGWTFTFKAPAPGSTFTLRGVVDFQWRIKRRSGGRLHTIIVRRAHANTKGGFESTLGADPPGYSNGICQIH